MSSNELLAWKLFLGFMWKEQLVLKSKLQVPSSKDKSARAVVPEVTAIFMSK